jgi:hypothetical protein
MLSALFHLFTPCKETHREKALSNQVDMLEFELQKKKRELEAAEIRANEQQRFFEEHTLRNYPATTSWVKSISTADLFNNDFENPVEYVLADVEALGYDVSAAWMTHRAMLDLAKQHQQGLASVIMEVERLQNVRAEAIN